MKPHKNSRRTVRYSSGIKLPLFFLCAAVLLLNAAAAWVQNEFSKELAGYVREQSAGHGVILKHLDFRCSGFSSWNTLRWKKVEAQIEMNADSAFSKNRSFSVSARSLEVSWVEVLPPLFEIRANGIKVKSHVVTETLGNDVSRPEIMDQGRMRFKMVYTFWNAKKARREAGSLFNKLLGLIRTGKTPLALDFKTAVYFNIRGSSLKAAIESRRIRGQTYLHMPVQDLIAVSAVLDERLTSAEIEILSENPLWAPQLLMIRNDARTTAYRAGKKDASVPKDAYRHILWSYLLTREFGEVFAEKVTRAHEINPVLSNTEAQKNMDFHNNAIGRKYARLGYDESTLLKRLMKDPEVIRYSTKGRKS